MIRGCISLAVLDMAGTTLDVTDAVPVALRSAFREIGIDLPEASIEAVRGRSKRQAIRALPEQFATDRQIPATVPDEVFASFRRRLELAYARGVSPIAGATDTLRFLRAEGIPVVLTTGFDRRLAEQLLNQVGWNRDLVDGLVSADDVRQGRPDPATIRRAMEMLGIRTPDRVMAVGDTRADLDAAHSAGAGWGIGVLTGAHSRERLETAPHAAILDSVADLPSWLEALTRSNG